MAESNGNGKLFRGVMYSVLAALLIATGGNAARLWREFAVVQERADAMAKVDAWQTQQLAGCSETTEVHSRTILLLTERQDRLMRANETQSIQLAVIQSLNAEQQFQLNTMTERLRLLERQQTPH